MADIIYSPDGQFLWTGTKWVAVNSGKESIRDTASSNPGNEFWARGSTTNSANDQNYAKIENLARVMIDKLNRHDMITAKECWTQAKMIDLTITELIFEQQYAKEISDGYLKIAEFELNQFELLYHNPHTVDITFRVKVEMATNPIELALFNSSTFLSQHISFGYNILYAKMWLYCRRFNLVWNREICQKKYELHLGVAQRLASNSVQINDCKRIERIHNEQISDIRNENANQLVIGIILLFVGIISFLYIID